MFHMPQDPHLIPSEIDRLALAAHNLAAIARSLWIENEELREAARVTLSPRETWPHLADLPVQEREVFVAWLDRNSRPSPGAFDYYPWDYDRWQLELAGKVS